MLSEHHEPNRSQLIPSRAGSHAGDRNRQAALPYARAVPGDHSAGESGRKCYLELEFCHGNGMTSFPECLAVAQGPGSACCVERQAVQAKRSITGLPLPSAVTKNGRFSTVNAVFGEMPIAVRMVACRSVTVIGFLVATHGRSGALSP